MHAQRLECLRCGKLWTEAQRGVRGVHEAECPRCGYLGWAETAQLTETTRRLLRDCPPELRAHRPAA